MPLKTTWELPNLKTPKGMLNKIFGVRKLRPPFLAGKHPHQNVVDEGSDDQKRLSSSALKIVHAGGSVECYYMAVPALRILEKYPSSLLTRPEVFREPWDSVVRPEEILMPGQKFFVVPRQTIRKLRKRIHRPTVLLCHHHQSSMGIDTSAEHETSASCSGIIVQQGQDRHKRNDGSASESDASGITVKRKGINRHVRFCGTMDHDNIKKKREDGLEMVLVDSEADEPVSKRKAASGLGGRRRRSNSNSKRRAIGWLPTLQAINESQGTDN